jgi:hypothetical protein
MRESYQQKRSRSWFGGFTLALTATAIAVGTPIHEVQAQPTDPGQITEILEQARQIYEELLPVAQRLRDAALTTRIRSLRTQWLEARGHLQGRRYRQAGLLAKRNLEQFRQLATTLRRLAQRLPYYSRLAERNRELLQFLHRSVGPDAPAEVLRQLTLAADAVERAQLAYTRRNLLQAFRLMEQSETLLRQVLRFVDRAGLTLESVQRELEETNRRIEQVAATPDLTAPAREALERARTSQSEAERFFAAGELRPALARTLTARTALRLAMRLTAGALTPEDVAAAIGHAEELMEVHAEVANSKIPEARNLWQQAQRQLNGARTLLEAEQLRPALEAAQTTAKLILTAVRWATTPIPPPPPGEGM